MYILRGLSLQLWTLQVKKVPLFVDIIVHNSKIHVWRDDMVRKKSQSYSADKTQRGTRMSKSKYEKLDPFNQFKIL